MSNMFSYSKVSCFENCQYQFFIKYILKLEAKFDEKPDNALVLGTAVHESIETKDPIEAIKKYYSNYSKLTIDNEIEAYKVKLVAENAIKDLPRGIYEYKLMSDEFIGFIDMLVEVSPGVYDIYDFKYSNNVSSYIKSAQVHVYKYYYEQLTGNKVRNLYYVFLPKSKTVWNHVEPLEQFLDKLHAELSAKHANVKQVVYNPELVAEWLNKRDAIIKHIENNNSYSKNINKLCYWCQFKKYCESNGKDLSEIVIKDPVQSF